MNIEKRIDDDDNDDNGLMTRMIEIILLLAMSGAMVEIDTNGILAREVTIVITIIEIRTDIKTTDTTIGFG